jgi:hypothetical protein
MKKKSKKRENKGGTHLQSALQSLEVVVLVLAPLRVERNQLHLVVHQRQGLRDVWARAWM